LRLQSSFLRVESSRSPYRMAESLSDPGTTYNISIIDH